MSLAVTCDAHSRTQRLESAPTLETTRALSGYRLGRLLGVEVVADWRLLIIFALVTFNLGAGVFPRWRPDWSLATVWGTAIAAALLFFSSV